ncbi:hypothetical protein GPECTOR_6g660 [Gonium pectorale]|uniref:Tyrosine-protein kinase catalytic domain-containing protein n=1 Tax=Gonium pectorale TaxID=33097 RepID=A0A150GVF5_GONPE|nr:hypothetical protein GPECTOR_6g660 [Gonium pectorale]|eukprot:KXZ53743.1 hypothetical protein GPECTOR_6g660 [Gonium pectorale]
MARSSQNHALSALSRFSAQLRKNEDISVREGSRHGYVRANSGRDVSVRAGKALSTVAPPLFKELSDLKPAERGRLATALHGIWQQQQRVVVKVVSHRMDCSFMLEQVGEVWSRLAHPNIVACSVADTFPASAVTSLPHVAELVPRPTDAEAVLQTWLVLERCDNGSLACVLAQRAALQAAARRAVTASAGPAADGKGSSPAKYIARRLGRFSRPSRGRRRSTETADDGPNTNTSSVAGGDGKGEVTSSAPAEPSLASEASPAGDTSAGEALQSPSPQTQPSPASQPASMGSQQSSLVKQLTALGAATAGEEGAEAGLPGLLSVSEILSIAHDVASGLAYLHSLDLCHGDLRAENVMMQTVVLPSSARSLPTAAGGPGNPGCDVQAADGAGGDGDAGDGGGMSMDPEVPDNAAAASGVELRGGSAGGAIPAHGRTPSGVDDVLVAMYNSGNSDVADPYGGAGGPRRQHTYVSSYAGTMTASVAAADSSAHAWSSSLRHSAGYMSGSTFASTVTTGLAAHATGGVGGVHFRMSGFDPSSVDEKVGLTAPYVSGTAGAAPAPQQPAFGTATSGRAGGSVHGGGGGGGGSHRGGGPGAGGGDGGSVQTRQLPNLLPSPALAPGAAAGGEGSGGPQPAPAADGALVSPFAAHALARTSSLGPRGQGPSGAGAGPATPGMQLGHGGTPFVRKPSTNSLSGNQPNSANDMSAMSKTLSGLTAWPESPQEGRNVSHLSAAGAADRSSVSSGAGGLSRSIAASSLGAATPPRKPTIVGGLKTALTAPDAAARPSPARQPAAGAAAAAGEYPRQGSSPGPLPEPRRDVNDGAASRGLAAASTPAASGGVGPNLALRSVATSGVGGSQAGAAVRFPECSLPDDSRSTGGPAVQAVLARTVATARLPGDPEEILDPAVITPRIIAVHAIDSPITRISSPARSQLVGCSPPEDGLTSGPASGPASRPASSPETDAGSNPATPTAHGVESSDRSRTSVGLVCTIAGRNSRRCSAPPVVALPVIRKVAKLTDPWLSLACLPADIAGGAWSPEAAAAVGAVSGADISHLPPELLLSGRLHPASDVYSLGVLMWRMLSPSGEAPYSKLLPAEVAYKVVACGMRPAFSPVIPEQLRRLVEDCWQSDPAARPSVQQLLSRLADLQPHAAALQRQWRERQTLFGAVATMPISAVAVLPLRGEHNEIAARWAEVAGIRLQRSNSLSWGGAGGRGGAGASGGGAGGPQQQQQQQRRGA